MLDETTETDAPESSVKIGSAGEESDSSVGSTVRTATVLVEPPATSHFFSSKSSSPPQVTRRSDLPSAFLASSL